MAKLKDVAKLVRSKNAGPFMLTFDVLFDDPATYARARDARILGPEVISRIYGVPVEKVQYYEYDAARALKATIPRPIASGDLGDSDIYGGQQHGPLLDLEVPER
ncbi:MAG: DUF4387 domain-containing protein [Chloroflexi bacterium]|nr:DUF4387 domain-containing protein [Chloroflexota bacterium]